MPARAAATITVLVAYAAAALLWFYWPGKHDVFPDALILLAITASAVVLVTSVLLAITYFLAMDSRYTWQNMWNASVVFCLAAWVALGLLKGAEVGGLVAPPTSIAGTAGNPFAHYVAAVRDAAVLTPENSKGGPLATIDLHLQRLTFVAFKAAARPPQSPLKATLWVALPEQLKQRCAGEPDAERALQQILGLPPTSEPRLVYEIVANPRDVFRPCISDQKPDAASCTFPPPTVTDPAPAASAADAAAETLRAAYDRLHRSYQDLAEVAGHLLTSHSLGFRQDYEAKPGDYPDKGFPFTGLGWTYDWRPGAAATHFGVSEFVVRQGAEIEIKPGSDPQVFCAAQK